MKIRVAFACILLLTSACFADSMDEAEAKKRGVAVEVVQLEREKNINAALLAKVSELSAQVSKLKKQIENTQAEEAKAKAELDKLKSSLTPDQKAQVLTSQTKEQEIAEGIRKHQLVIGMTLEQAKKAMPTYCNISSKDENGEVWVWHFHGSATPDVDVYGTFENGILVRFSNPGA